MDQRNRAGITTLYLQSKQLHTEYTDFTYSVKTAAIIRAHYSNILSKSFIFDEPGAMPVFLCSEKINIRLGQRAVARTPVASTRIVAGNIVRMCDQQERTRLNLVCIIKHRFCS